VLPLYTVAAKKKGKGHHKAPLTTQDARQVDEGDDRRDDNSSQTFVLALIFLGAVIGGVVVGRVFHSARRLFLGEPTVPDRRVHATPGDDADDPCARAARPPPKERSRRASPKIKSSPQHGRRREHLGEESTSLSTSPPDVVALADAGAIPRLTNFLRKERPAAGYSTVITQDDPSDFPPRELRCG